MIYKTDPRNNTMIQEYGCYWFSIFWFIEQAGLATFDDPVAIEALYQDHLAKGWIDNECTVLNGEAIFASYGLKVKLLKVQGDFKLPPSFVASEGDFEIQSWTWKYTHFVPAVNELVAWDSIQPPGSYSIKNGKLDSKRIYRPVAA